jgi:hypothetical protein
MEGVMSKMFGTCNVMVVNISVIICVFAHLTDHYFCKQVKTAFLHMGFS